jgi:hypothetical protein
MQMARHQEQLQHRKQSLAIAQRHLLLILELLQSHVEFCWGGIQKLMDQVLLIQVAKRTLATTEI